MINAAELPAREIFNTKPAITQHYQELLCDFDAIISSTEHQVISLRYNKKNNAQNIVPLDSNTYILLNGNIALLRNIDMKTDNCNINSVALQYINTPGFIINPYSLVELEENNNPSHSIYPLENSEVLNINHESSLKLFNINNTFRNLVLSSCLVATEDLLEQSQIRSPKQGLITLFVNYLLSNQKEGFVTISNVDLTTIFGTNEWNIKRIIRNLLENNLITKTQNRMTLQLTDMASLEAIANDY